MFVSNTTIFHCPMFGCGHVNERSNRTKPEDIVCEGCHAPWWPMELGFIGNDPKENIEFARTHDRKGNLRELA